MATPLQRRVAEKVCTRCKTLKPISEYYIRHKTLVSGKPHTYWTPSCKKCHCERELKRTKGVSAEELQFLLNSQNHRCKICKTPESQNGKQFAVDHCHSTGVIRGLLCAKCNIGLGCFDDDVERLAEAILYIEHSRKNPPPLLRKVPLKTR